MEVLAGVAGRHQRQLLGRQVEVGVARRAQQGEQPERLDGAPEVDEPVRVADDVEHPAGRIDLDDVAAMDGLHQAVAHLADEDRRRRGRAGT